ncbi:hypothetical protein AaE_003623 [Aphanomyces astaci]|uniref:GAG-pre-integrase domain-containing protein n=1 Tax=Aphanomyces astaci TaxID=112090 RepID=A0A6A5ALC6_APHAT|nr:hypothetical protein AaE_003623 [Aphanomyces astaci]
MKVSQSVLWLDMCEITTSLGDVLRAPNNAMGLYSFPCQPKCEPSTDPHRGEYIHPGQMAMLTGMMATFETAVRKFSSTYSGFSTFNDQLHMFAYSSVLRYAPITQQPSMVSKPSPFYPITPDSVSMSVAQAMLGSHTSTPVYDTTTVPTDCLISLMADSKLSAASLARLWHRRLGHPGVMPSTK